MLLKLQLKELSFSQRFSFAINKYCTKLVSHFEFKIALFIILKIEL